MLQKKLQKDWNNVADYPDDDAGWNPAKNMMGRSSLKWYVTQL